MLKKNLQTLRTLFRIFVRFCALVCALGFVFTLVIAMLLTNAEAQLFRSETYKHALQTSGTYARLPTLISQQIVAGLALPPEWKMPGYLQPLSDKDWEALVRTALPEDLLRQMSEQTLDQFFDYLNGKSGRVEVSMVALKQKLRQKSMDAAEMILNAQPACTLEQLASISLGIAGASQPGQETLCNPPTALKDIFLPLLNPALQAEIATIPDAIPVFDRSRPPDFLPALAQARQQMRLSLLVPLALLVSMSLLAVRSRKGWRLWWGIPLALAGALGLLTGALNEPIARLIFLVQTPHLPAFLAQAPGMALALFLAVAREVATPLMVQSAWVLAVGAGMIAWAKYDGG